MDMKEEMLRCVVAYTMQSLARLDDKERALEELERYIKAVYGASVNAQSFAVGCYNRFRDNKDCSESWSYLFKLIKGRFPNSAAVYFVENHDGTRVKIGRTKTLWRRFEEINCTSGGECRIVFAIPTIDESSSKDLEKVMQKTYHGPHISGEWFVARSTTRDYVTESVELIRLGLGMVS